MNSPPLSWNVRQPFRSPAQSCVKLSWQKTRSLQKPSPLCRNVPTKQHLLFKGKHLAWARAEQTSQAVRGKLMPAMADGVYRQVPPFFFFFKQCVCFCISVTCLYASAPEHQHVGKQTKKKKPQWSFWKWRFKLAFSCTVFRKSGVILSLWQALS